jgi:peptidoglycan hydrolase-like protein with peptidoglycan-binding domain
MTAFVQARHYRPGRLKPLRVIVWHDMEAPEKSTTAESVAHYFATTDREASAHVCADPDSVVECVKVEDTAFHAPGANSDGYGVELAGYARQSPAEWRDATSKATIHQAAVHVAPIMREHGIPAKWLTDAELAGGTAKGMTTHAQVTRVFKKSTHTDPGAGFPADFVLAEVQHALGEPIAPAKKAPTKKAPAKKAAAPKKPAHTVVRKGDSGPMVGHLQTRLNAHGAQLKADGEFGRLTDLAVRAFQDVHDLTVDGVVGPETWAALDKAPAASKSRPTVRRGMGSKEHPDENVRHAQLRLNAHGARLLADGVFGAATEQAAKDFQRRRALNPVTGIIDGRVWPWLERSP